MAKNTISRKTSRQPVANKTASADPTTPTITELSAEAVALRAYAIYLEEGRPDGRHLDHWTRAESELRSV